jgi:hypothetical protein
MSDDHRADRRSIAPSQPAASFKIRDAHRIQNPCTSFSIFVISANRARADARMAEITGSHMRKAQS